MCMFLEINLRIPLFCFRWACWKRATRSLGRKDLPCQKITRDDNGFDDFTNAMMFQTHFLIFTGSFVCLLRSFKDASVPALSVIRLLRPAHSETLTILRDGKSSVGITRKQSLDVCSLQRRTLWEKQGKLTVFESGSEARDSSDVPAARVRTRHPETLSSVQIPERPEKTDELFSNVSMTIRIYSSLFINIQTGNTGDMYTK